MSRRFIYYVIASLSGASALIFENLWFRSASLVLGSGVWSSALVLALRLERRAVPAPKARTKTVQDPRLRPVWALLVAGFCSGAMFLSFEALFFRFQLLFFASLSTTFAVMLAVALAGIAVGGAGAGRFLSRGSHAQSWLPVMSFGAGLALLLSYRWFPAVLEPAVRMTPVAGALLTTLMLPFPVACLSGAMFTLIGQAVHFAGRSEASATARLTIANTIGGAVGSVSTGFYLIPVFGLEACFRVLIDCGTLPSTIPRWSAHSFWQTVPACADGRLARRR